MFMCKLVFFCQPFFIWHNSFEFETIDTGLIHAVSRAIKNKLQGRLIQEPKTYCGTRHPCVNKATWLNTHQGILQGDV